MDAGEAHSARNTEGAARGAEALARTRERTIAGWDGLMEAGCERGNLPLAYQRVVRNKGTTGVDGITVTDLKEHLTRKLSVKVGDERVLRLNRR